MAKRRGRGQGEGSIFKRRDGRWCAGLNLGWKNGKRHRKWFYGPTRDAVQRQLTAALRAQQQGLPVAPERQTVQHFLTRWLTDCAKPSVRPSTFVRYRELVSLHIVPELGHIVLSKLSPQQVQAFLNAKVGAPAASKPGCGRPAPNGLSARTVQHCHAVLRCALGQALKWGLVPRNVATLVNPPRAPHHEIRPLSPEDATRFLATVRGDRFEALYSVALACGLRRGEALGLRWQDGVDLEGGTLTVRHALQRVNGRLQLVEPKTARSRRTIALPETCVKALRSHRVRQLQERLLAGSRWQETGFVFTSTIGTPVEPDNLRRQFKAALSRAGLPAQRFHDLRHTSASLLLAQGVHPRTVMEILGHSQISLTMNTYSHVMPVVLRDAADKMDAILACKK
jgi:integrase